MSRSAAGLLVVSILISACREPLANPRVPESRNRSSVITDGAHNNGNPHFYLLPPLVPATNYRGQFDETFSPVVTICAWDGMKCSAPPLAEFTTTSGPGSETVRVDREAENYIVNWHTDSFGLDPAVTYRIRVLVAGTELGHADVDAVSTGKELKNVNTGHFIPLVNGRTLPIKFRIEKGAVFVVGSAGGEMSAVGGQVLLSVPPQALSHETGITVRPLTTLPTTPKLLAGAAFDFGPDGTAFSEPARLIIRYDPLSLPPGLSEQALRLYTQENGVWVEVPESHVDAEDNSVTGYVNHFSPQAIGAQVPPASVQVTRAAWLGSGIESQLLVRAFDGLGNRVYPQWSSSDDRVAAVRPGGIVAGASQGSATITASFVDRDVQVPVTISIIPTLATSSDGFTWPTDPTNSSRGSYQTCADGPPDCFWLVDPGVIPSASAVWRDVNPFVTTTHLGADWNLGAGASDMGRLVWSAGTGVVTAVLDGVPGWGKMVFVKHGTNGASFVSVYGHVSWPQSGRPEVGQGLQKGISQVAVIGDGDGLCVVPQTNRSCSPHLHFEVRDASHPLSMYPGDGYDPPEQGQRNPNAFIAAWLSPVAPQARDMSGTCSITSSGNLQCAAGVPGEGYFGVIKGSFPDFEFCGSAGTYGQGPFTVGPIGSLSFLEWFTVNGTRGCDVENQNFWIAFFEFDEGPYDLTNIVGFLNVHRVSRGKWTSSSVAAP